MSGLYEQLINLFIKPARQSYSDHDLGPTLVTKTSIRQNFSFISHKGYDIKVSFFKNNNHTSNTCIIYLHSFNGSRLQSLRYASEIMEKGFQFCSFDFAGCGNSGGEYVTLGCNQRWDVLKLMQKLKSRYGLTQFFIWGRSMGAVTAVKFFSLLAQEQRQGSYTEFTILGLILDSAFISLKRMVVEVGSRLSSMPQFLVKAVFLMVSSSIEERAGFKIDDLQLQSDVQSIRCSTLLITSSQDTFVSHKHSEQIFGKLKLHDNKQIIYTKGEHYEQRDKATLSQVYTFFEKNQKRYSQYVNSLRQAIKTNDHSLDKPTRSLKKYQPQTTKSSKMPQKIQFPHQRQYQDCARILFRSNADDKEMKLTPQFRTDKKIPNKQPQLCQRQYQTQKRISQFSPHVKFVFTSQKEIRNNDEIKNSNKPNLICKVKKNEQYENSQNIQRPLRNAQCTQSKASNMESHCNIIADRLRKKGKYHHKDKIVEFKSNVSDHLQFHTTQNQQKGKGKTKINFHICNPSNHTDHSINNEKQTKKLSMTAQQYKNNQIKKGSNAALSPNGKPRQTNLSELKLKSSDADHQVRSMTNLFALGEKGKYSKNPYLKLNHILAIQPNH